MNSKFIVKIGIATILMSFFVVILPAVQVNAVNPIPFVADNSISVKAKYAFVIDDVTNSVLYSKNADTRFDQASVAKIMTAYLVRKKVGNNSKNWQKKVKVTDKKLVKFNKYWDSKLWGYKKSYTVSLLYKFMLVQSNNTAAELLAKWVKGSESKFATLMNKTAKNFGLKNTHYRTPYGCEPYKTIPKRCSKTAVWSKRTYTTAKELALLSKKITDKYPDILKVTKIYKFKSGKKYYYNTSGLLPEKSKNVASLGFDGLKTGSAYNYKGFFSNQVATSKLPERDRIIISVMDSSDKTNDIIKIANKLYAQTQTLQPEPPEPDEGSF
jgi:D-alanyl-D-alanine carboxypeptidase